MNEWHVSLFTLRERSPSRRAGAKDRLTTSVSLAEGATDLVRQTEANTNTEKNLKAFQRFFLRQVTTYNSRTKTNHNPLESDQLSLQRALIASFQSHSEFQYHSDVALQRSSQ